MNLRLEIEMPNGNVINADTGEVVGGISGWTQWPFEDFRGSVRLDLQLNLSIPASVFADLINPFAARKPVRATATIQRQDLPNPTLKLEHKP